VTEVKLGRAARTPSGQHHVMQRRIESDGPKTATGSVCHVAIGPRGDVRSVYAYPSSGGLNPQTVQRCGVNESVDLAVKIT